jgi:hypothetical protein
MPRNKIFCTLLIEVRALLTAVLSQLFQLTIWFKIVAAQALLQRWKHGQRSV